MDVSLFIAKRLRFKGRIAVVSIAVSFFVMIVSVSISSGFRNEIRDGISYASGDVQLTPVNLNYLDESSPIDREPSYLKYVDSIPGVISVSPAVYRGGIVKSGDDIQGVLFKGVEMSGNDSLPALGISIPRSLSEKLSISEGDDMTSYFVGEKVRVRKFKVMSVYDGVLDSGEDMVVLAGIGDLQRLNGWDSTQVSVLEVRLDRRLRSVRGLEEMEREIGSLALLYSGEDDATVVATSAVSRYPQIFDWLNLIDFNVFFILVLMTIVAGFNMISGLLIILFENIPLIGLLKSLGMTDRRIAGIFLASSSSAVLKGMLWGNVLSLLFCIFQSATHAIRLDPGNYFISFVPVHVDFAAVLIADLAAYTAIMLLLLIPSLFITRVDPAKTVRIG